MKIALTKKLAEAMEIKVAPIDENIDPLFIWTANWTNVYSNRKKEDLLVLVNNATRFVVAVYQVKKKDLKKASALMEKAIANSLLDLNLNQELVDEYMRQAGAIEFARNTNRAATSWVNRSCLECAIMIGERYSGVAKMFDDTLGKLVNGRIVSTKTNSKGYFRPDEEMIGALSTLTGKKPFNYQALELTVTLDLEEYQAIRRLIVPANLKLTDFHEVLQKAFAWRNYHLYDFTVYENNQDQPSVRLVAWHDDLEYDQKAVMMGDHTVGDVLMAGQRLVYTYDYGDNWVHEIKLDRVLDNYDQAAPFQLEAKGQTPPEDVGGVPGFLEFLKIMKNPEHPDYQAMRDWSGYWNVELGEWASQPRKIDV